MPNFGQDLFVFQLDSAPVHKARSIKKWFSQFGLEELDWPAQSPDLNLIQHLWDDLDWARFWEQIPAAQFQNLVESLKPGEWKPL